MMTEHPEPPPDLERRRLLIHEVEGPVFRIHRASNSPLYFGTAARNRFDAPAGEFGVLYCAQDEWGAFIETFGQSTGIQSISVNSLIANPIAKLSLKRDLRLADLAGSGGLARVGADGRLCTGDHELARRWCHALWKHPEMVDGIAYGCRHDPVRVALAVFDRAADAIEVAGSAPLISAEHEALLGKILDTYQFGLID